MTPEDIRSLEERACKRLGIEPVKWHLSIRPPVALSERLIVLGAYDTEDEADHWNHERACNGLGLADKVAIYPCVSEPGPFDLVVQALAKRGLSFMVQPVRAGLEGSIWESDEDSGDGGAISIETDPDDWRLAVLLAVDGMNE